MSYCFRPSKLDAAKHEVDSLKLLLQTRENELERLRRSETSQRQKDEQQTEALQAAAAHVAQLEARLTMERIEQQRASKELEAQLRMEYEQKLLGNQQRADHQRSILEAELQGARKRLEEQQLLGERQRKQFEETVHDQKQKMEKLAERARQADLQRQLLEARLLEEQQKRLEQERRTRRYQKQIANFTETMEEVSNILTAVEGDTKTKSSPVKTESKKGKAASVAADQLRQSIALFKRTTDERPSDQGEERECT
ncbi:hypothetical protein PLESTB_000072300 [Pleodorina starrii]|uniref:Uncharacterized protein n=1 Tax=Pleodorina starrii TaxID=330485 RepID=A0A9W6EWN3_9CHLO|nr:hypothetical protein PLESTM_000067900 [Pleodorina starrii]GLC48223.1 hypothetical protein PLESTB_000072300 [Pleodorina starrii]GLC66513.1 hypothetical protein PLESTF_000438600 [Pleodorina starrii]